MERFESFARKNLPPGAAEFVAHLPPEYQVSANRDLISKVNPKASLSLSVAPLAPEHQVSPATDRRLLSNLIKVRFNFATTESCHAQHISAKLYILSARMDVSICPRAHTHTDTHTHTHTHTHTRMDVSICPRARTHTHTHELKQKDHQRHNDMCVRTHTHTHTHTCEKRHMSTYTYATHDTRVYTGTQESRSYRVTYSSATVALSKDAARELQLGLRVRAQESINIVLR